MKPRDILKLTVQILGLVFLYQGLLALPEGVFQFCRAIPSLSFDDLLASFVRVGWPLLIAYWLLRGAPLIMGIAYPDAEGRAESDKQAGGVVGKKAGA